ncbi:Helicase protein MOM1-like protein [Drosera capensis]
MGKVTRAAGVSKDDEEGSSNDQCSDGVQRSTGGDSSRNQSGSKTRKSERLEKLTPTKASEQLEKQGQSKPSNGKRPDIVQDRIQSPLRRSERGKKLQPSSSLSLRREEKSSSSDNLKKNSDKKEKRVEELGSRAKGVERLGQDGSKTDHRSTKRIDARTYRLMLKMHQVNASATKVRRPLEYSPVKSNNDCNGTDKLQNGVMGQTAGNEDGASHSSVGRLNDVDVKWSKPDSRFPFRERLRSGNFCDSSDSVNMGSRKKPSDVELKGLNSDVRDRSVSETRKVEDGTGSSHSMKDDNCIEDIESGDGCGLSLPKRNPNNGEQMQVDPFMTEKDRTGDGHMSTGKIYYKGIACGSDHGGITSDRKRGYSGHVGNKDNSTTADILPSSCRCDTGCSYQSCSAGSKRQRIGVIAAPDYVQILSALKSGGKPDAESDNNADTNHSVSMLKESFSQCTFSGCKSQPSRFAEYLVPVHLSNLQLEQYSSIMLSNSMSLRSCLKNDLVGALHDILVSMLKCCNHPYVTDPSLQSSLAKNCVGNLCDIGCEASGKLQLLDTILSESKGRGLRFLILYQPVGSDGKDSMGDILEDYLQYRFGTDAYERIDAFGYRISVKQAACNNFNTVKSRFIFLLESRACLSSIKLSAVDAIIIFNSDRNPLNDLRALQKIAIDSKSEQINVFRLYSIYTVEENILALAKNGGNVPSISRSNHMLLMMGASYLFSKLDEFHRDSDSDLAASIVPKDSFIKDVLLEFLSLFENHGKEVPFKFMSKAQRDGERYQKNSVLLGELMDQHIIEESPLDFWAKLLDGRQPKWKYLSTSSQRSRKRPQYFESPPKIQDSQNDGSPRKRKKVGASSVDSSLVKNGAGAGRGFLSRNEKVSPETMTKELSESSWKPVDGNGLQEVPRLQMVESEGKGKLLDEQRRLLQILRPQISELCQVLQLQEDSSKCAEQFLEYVINNHRVSKEPESILQAFKISVCWTAASLMGQKVDHKESVVLARVRLKLICKEDEAELVYSKMKSLKRAFLLRSKELRSAHSKDPSSVPSGHMEKTLDSNSKEAVVSNFETLNSRAEEGSPSQTVYGAQEDILKKVNKVEKRCRRRMGKLKEKQIMELEELHRNWEAKEEILEKMQRVESVLIHSIHTNIATRADKLKQLANDYAKRCHELEHKMTTHLKDLQAEQQMEKNEEQLKAASLVKDMKLWVQEQLLNKPPSMASTKMGVNLHATEQNFSPEGPKDADSFSRDPVEQQSPDRLASCEPGNHAESPNGSSELAKGKVDFVASETVLYSTDKHARAVDDTRYNLGARQISDVPLSDNPLGAEPLMSASSDLAVTQDMTVIPIDEGMPDVVLQDVPMQQCDAAPEGAIGGTTLEDQMISNLQTEQNADQMDTGVSKESTSLATSHHVGDSNLACPELQIMQQPPVVRSSMAESQECIAQSGQPLAVRDLAESFSEASLAHYVNATPLESEGSSPIIVAEPTCILPFLIDEETTSSTDIHEQKPTVYNTSRQAILPSVVNQHSADSVNIVPESASAWTSGVPAGSGISFPNARSSLPRFSGVPMQLSSSMTLEPLQVEYDRVCREKDLAVDVHEKKMSQLVKDRDKEIEEVVAQICQKYDSVRAETEASFSVKEKELDMIQKKVLMNKHLAEAFRLKVPDYRALLGMRQAAHVNHAQQPLQQQRPATMPVSGISSAPSSSTSSVYGQILASISAPTAPAPAAPAPAPSGRVAVRSPTPLPNNPVRPPRTQPPVISSISPNISSYQQNMVERRAPPPHLQSFRSPMSMPPKSRCIQIPGMAMPQQPIVSSPSFPSRSMPPHLQTTRSLPRTPMQVTGSASHVPSYPASASVGTPQAPVKPSQLQLSPPQALVITSQEQTPPEVPADDSGSHIRANLSDMGRRLATFRLQEYYRSIGLNPAGTFTSLPEQ